MKKILVLFVVLSIALSACLPQTRTPGTSGTTVLKGTPIPVEMPVLTESSQSTPQSTPQNEIVTALITPVDQDLIISEIRHQDGLETIVVKNISSEDIDASLYMLFLAESSQKYVFPANLLVKAGAEVEVYNGKVEGLPSEYVWQKEMALTTQGETLILVTPSGMILQYFDYYPTIP